MNEVPRTPSTPRRIVVIGGGVAGLRVARGLSGRVAAITPVDRHNDRVRLITDDNLVWNTPPVAAPARVERRQAFRQA
jgi:glycine/D-amino acid oxidase-like deaminating enzyme